MPGTARYDSLCAPPAGTSGSRAENARRNVGRWCIAPGQALSGVGTGQTVIRVDAQDTWQQTKTAAQRVPSTVTEVTVAQVRASGPISVGDTTAVTSASLVRKIVTLVNALPLYPTTGVRSCRRGSRRRCG